MMGGEVRASFLETKKLKEQKEKGGMERGWWIDGLPQTLGLSCSIIRLLEATFNSSRLKLGDYTLMAKDCIARRE